MAHDPTAWPTPMHAWRFWTAEAETSLKTMFEIRAGYEDKHGKSLSTDRIIGEDVRYQAAVGDWQFAVAQAAMYADWVQIRLLEAILAKPGRP